MSYYLDKHSPPKSTASISSKQCGFSQGLMRHDHLSMFSWANASLDLANLLFITITTSIFHSPTNHRQPYLLLWSPTQFITIYCKQMLSQSKFENIYLYENSCQPLTNIQPCPPTPRLMLVTTKIYLTKTQHHDLFARYVQVVQYKSPLSGHGLYIYFFPSGCSTIASPPQQSAEPGPRFTTQV